MTAKDPLPHQPEPFGNSEVLPPRLWVAMMDGRDCPGLDGVYFQVDAPVALMGDNEHDQLYVHIKEHNQEMLQQRERLLTNARADIAAAKREARAEAFEEAAIDCDSEGTLGRLLSTYFRDKAQISRRGEP